MIEVILPVLSALVALAVGFAVSRRVVSKGALGEAYTLAYRAAIAAEEVFGGTEGAEKLDYAASIVLNRFHLSRAEAEMLVNSAVKGLRLAGIKTTAPQEGTTPPDGAAALRAIG